MVGRIFFSPRNRVAQAGFTIVELMVTIGIVAVLGSVILANYPELNGRLTLDLLAHDVALSVRQAQQFALGVRQQNVSGTQNAVAYGIHFDTATPNSYFLFSDVADSSGIITPDSAGQPIPNFKYDITTPQKDQNIGSGQLPAGMMIKQLCIRKASDAPTLFDTCTSDPLYMGSAHVSTLDMVFKRPNPDTSMNGVVFTSSTAFVEAAVVLGTTRGSATKRVHIFQSGQISVK